MALGWRRLGRGWAAWMVCVTLLAHEFMPLAAAAGGGDRTGPWADVCSVGGVSSPASGDRAPGHDAPCCKLHCLSAWGGAPVAAPVFLSLAGDLRFAVPPQPTGWLIAAPHVSPFAARAPPETV